MDPLPAWRHLEVILSAMKAIYKKHFEYPWYNNTFPSISTNLMTELKYPGWQNIP